jgi:putative flippase GtrA
MPDSDLLTLIKQAGRFAVVGGSGLIVNLVLLTGLVEVVNIPEPYAAVISTGVVLLGGFVFTDSWVFGEVGDQDTPVANRGTGYFAVMVSGKLLNYGLYLILLSFDVPYLAAWFVGSIFVFVLTFTGNRMLWYVRF